MAIFKKKSLKEERKYADRLLQLAYKVYNYRRDLMKEEEVEEVISHAEDLKTLLNDNDLKLDALNKSVKKLDKVLRKYGEKIYPVTFWSENVEMFLVAAILAIGIRTFFFQPFKIPTNSMYPTYAGMLEHVYDIEEESPNIVERAWEKFTQFSTYYEVSAPSAGDLELPFEVAFDRNHEVWACRPVFSTVVGKKFFVLDAFFKQYELFVGDKRAPVKIPADFDMSNVILKTYFPDEKSFENVFKNKKYARRSVSTNPETRSPIYLIKPGKTCKLDDKILSFSIKTGDMLFVNRFSYNFFPPAVGDPFVFRTDNIQGINEEKYYIKRLVGKGGDRLKVDDYKLYSNGKLIEGTPVFQRNNEKTGDYGGYSYPVANTNHYVGKGSFKRISDKHYFAMGDNSFHSSDSRYWGEVPERSVIGKASFIFYPFTSRWGVSE